VTWVVLLSPLGNCKRQHIPRRRDAHIHRAFQARKARPYDTDCTMTDGCVIPLKLI
jgi:hypothetical protein